jgi:hypothetical protein
MLGLTRVLNILGLAGIEILLDFLKSVLSLTTSI